MRRVRSGADLPLQPLLDVLEAEEVDLPSRCWTIADRLPDHHRDPVDRMLIAHAILDDHELLTSDVTIKAYPVRTLW